MHNDSLGNLVKMANKIGGFFNSYTDRELARSEVANHIQKFWEPRMRHAILAYNTKHVSLGNDLLPLVREALKILPPPPPVGLTQVVLERSALVEH